MFPVERTDLSMKHLLQDSQRALGLVRKHAKDWGINPSKLGILGFSAGGHLSLMTLTSFHERTYPRMDEADDLSCRPDFGILVYPAYLVDRTTRDSLFPEVVIREDTPPCFFVHTGDDHVPAEGSALAYLALEKAGVVGNELHLFLLEVMDTVCERRIERSQNGRTGLSRGCEQPVGLIDCSRNEKPSGSLPSARRSPRGFAFGEIDLPAIGEGEVLIQLQAATIHPSDYGLIQGSYGQLRELPAQSPAEKEWERSLRLGPGVDSKVKGKLVLMPEEPGVWTEYSKSKAEDLLLLPSLVPLNQLAVSALNPVDGMASFE